MLPHRTTSEVSPRGRLSGARRRAFVGAAAVLGVVGATLLGAGVSGASQPVGAPPAILPTLSTSATVTRNLVASNPNGMVYKTVLADGDECLTIVNAQSTASETSCAHAAEAARYGVAEIQVLSDGQYSPGVTVLPPAGVSNVAFNLSDGSSKLVPVVNGVAQLMNPQLESAQFVLPSDGTTYTIGVPAEASAMAQPPTLPASG